MKKELLVLRLGWNDHYRIKSASSNTFEIIGMFLTTDYYVYGLSFLIEWINDPMQDGTNANITYLEKKDKTISLGDLLWEKGMPFVELKFSIDSFIKFLNDWEKIQKQKPKEIVITKNGDEIKIEGKN